MIVVRSCEVERVYTSGEMYARTGDTRPPGRDRRERPQQGPQSGKIVTYAEVDKEIVSILARASPPTRMKLFESSA